MTSSPEPVEPTVYWRPGCPFCLRLKAKLALSRTPYRAVNIWQDSAAADLVRSVNGGAEIVPTVQVGEVFLTNPRLRAIREAARG